MNSQTPIASPSKVDFPFWLKFPDNKPNATPATPRTPRRRVNRFIPYPPSPFSQLVKQAEQEYRADIARLGQLTPGGSLVPHRFIDGSPYREGPPFPTLKGTPHSTPAWLLPDYPRTPQPARASGEGDPMQALAATASTANNIIPSPGFDAPSPLFSGSLSPPLASPVAPAGEAVGEEGSESDGTEVEGESVQESEDSGSEYKGSEEKTIQGDAEFEYEESDGASIRGPDESGHHMAEADSPAIEATSCIHPKQDAVGGEAVNAGLDVRPLPQDLDDLLDLLQEGLHMQCLLPSARIGREIYCLSRLRLDNDGTWAPHGQGCQKTLGSEDSYRRHIEGRNHLRIGRGTSVEEWIAAHRPSAVERRFLRKDLVVEGARRKHEDHRKR